MSIPVAKKGTSQFIDEPLRKNATKKAVKQSKIKFQENVAIIPETINNKENQNSILSDKDKEIKKEENKEIKKEL